MIRKILKSALPENFGFVVHTKPRRLDSIVCIISASLHKLICLQTGGMEFHSFDFNCMEKYF